MQWVRGLLLWTAVDDHALLLPSLFAGSVMAELLMWCTFTCNHIRRHASNSSLTAKLRTMVYDSRAHLTTRSSVSRWPAGRRGWHVSSPPYAITCHCSCDRYHQLSRLKELALLPLPSENNVEAKVVCCEETHPQAGPHSTTRRLHRSLRVASHSKQDTLWNLLREEGKHHRLSILDGDYSLLDCWTKVMSISST